ncbi:Uncharacterised protein [Vibrio cholerae]|nr:Uncharacterised protein [Vibrio cholerae]
MTDMATLLARLADFYIHFWTSEAMKTNNRMFG